METLWSAPYSCSQKEVHPVASKNYELVSFIRESGTASPAEIAERFSVGARTVYNRINRANDDLAGIAQIERRGEGFALAVADDERFAEWLRRRGDALRTGMPTTSAERVRYLLNDLLFRTDWVTLDMLSSILYVSRVSISKDLPRVEERLGAYGLTLVRKPHYGIRVEGPEIGRRLCLASLVTDGGGEAGLDARTAPIARADLDAISQCIDTVLDENDMHINAVAYQNLLVHIAIALVRIKDACYLPAQEDYTERVKKSSAYPVAGAIARAIEERMGVALPEGEVAYIAIHLAGKRTLDVSVEDVDDAALVISDEVWDVVSRMLEKVWEAFRFDFRDDLELRMNLAKHVAPLAVRLTYHLSYKNPLLADVKERFPLAYSMALESAPVLADAYGAYPSEDEIGYLAFSFALALERKQSGAVKSNILVVCASGQGSARLLEYRYRKEFGAHLDRIIVCDVSEIDEVDFSEIDYVFTTVPLNRQLPVPVRLVKYFLDDADISLMNELFSAPVDKGLSCYDRRLFEAHLAATTPDEAIEALSALAATVEELPDDFSELVKERERIAPTAFGNLVALPHPMRAVSKRTFVAVGLLDEPVTWAGHEVWGVFLISLATERDLDLSAFYHTLLRVLMDTDAVRELLEDRRFETLLALVRRQQRREVGSV